MTENPENPTPPPRPEPRRLTRSKDDRYIAGVAGGLAKFLGLDPAVVRVVAVILVFFGGAGALLYAAAWLLVPEEGAPVPAGGEGQQRNRALVVLGVAVLLLIAWPLFFAPAALVFPLAFLVLAGLVTGWLATGKWPERQPGPI